MLRFYYVNRSTKTIFVYDTKPDSNENEFLGESYHPNPRAQAGMFLPRESGYRIVINPTEAI